MIKGFIILGVLVFGLGAWATLTNIHGAVVASGFFVVEGKPKSVQHLDGGIIKTIHVSNGDRVKAGDLLISMNSTIADAQIINLTHQDVSLHAEVARLESERNGTDSIQWPKIIRDNRSRPDVRSIMTDQAELFRARRELFDSRLRETVSMIKQSRNEITAAESQLNAKEFEIQSLSQDLDRLRILQRANAISIQRVTAVERDLSSARGSMAALQATLSRYEEQIVEAESRRNQLDKDRQEQILKALSDSQNRLFGVREQYTRAADIEQRSEIRATIDGVVHNLQFTTESGVIPAGKEIMQIIPVGGNLILEARVDPKDIDQIRFQQKAVVTLSAFHPSTVPQLNGEITKISADMLTDAATGKPYFNVSITLPQSEMERAKSVQVLSGMPADSFIQTSETTVLRYILKPVTTALGRTFREE
ncbi:HlyD family type I secretion periplasmic adaptor subunit [Algimonas arctica]|uniref:Membrane fusion protein (MFP) family protein n=1 Tax=Algimonas arctica TaxID=1479486 RepID=A0A8J3CTK0_9PROT|nr:HlyD family type I secretion periplasmic adaptor subunit [Algimonas arctica]GHB05585.1 HlyD family type I secretion periplasmic adaptor subunit [Algimonas arctica]